MLYMCIFNYYYYPIKIIIKIIINKLLLINYY